MDKFCKAVQKFEAWFQSKLLSKVTSKICVKSVAMERGGQIVAERRKGGGAQIRCPKLFV